MSSYWEFNTSLLDEKVFLDQLELMLKQELTGVIIGNSWWATIVENSS